ncbi:site-specific integrase [uncultured Tateyamaria sp.]|uniref:tyrosine-type recombinase/integrase n=1 Tax=uncultured Tateyamaria sp. TaxID=455651 RepID=UPI002613648B|nr:site-specific integrase [uncultured Tateyamaria sp.]
MEAKTLSEAKPEGQRVYNSQLLLLGSELTFKKVWEALGEDLEGRRTAEQMKSIWKNVGPFFGSYHPLEIDDALVRKYLEVSRKEFQKKNGREISRTTLFHDVNFVQMALNFAKRKKLIKESPHQLRKPSRSRPVDRWLTQTEIDTLLAETLQTPHLHIATVLMLSTAGRLGAILELTWDQVDFTNRTIDLRDDELEHVKNRAFVPMNDGTTDLLLDWRESCYSDFVVEYKGDRVHSIHNAFRKTVKRAKLPGKVTPHVLRHTSAVHLIANGHEMSRVSQYLGHSSAKVTEKIYARYAPDHLRKESDTVDFTKGRGFQLRKPVSRK